MVWIREEVTVCAQLEIIGVLNRNLGAQRGVMCSTGHFWGAQWEVMCSTGNYYVLNRTLLGAHQEVRYSTGSYVLNGKLLCAQLDIIGVLNGNLGAQQEVMCSMGNYYVLGWTLLESSTGI